MFLNKTEFKTPTRPVRTKFGLLVGKDSPYNDCENPYDIIWDPSSPSPITKGKFDSKATYKVTHISLKCILFAPPQKDVPLTPFAH